MIFDIIIVEVDDYLNFTRSVKNYFTVHTHCKFSILKQMVVLLLPQDKIDHFSKLAHVLITDYRILFIKHIWAPIFRILYNTYPQTLSRQFQIFLYCRLGISLNEIVETTVFDCCQKKMRIRPFCYCSNFSVTF